MTYPEVGKVMPDLTISNINYYPKKTAEISDFRGKWLLLDFWNIHCGACLVGFPVTNEIQRKLGNSVQVMLVGVADEEGKIAPMYAKFRDRFHLIMPCAFDSVLANRLDIYTAPHSILIDDKGVVQCVTTSLNLEDVRGFISGKPPDLPGSYRRMHEDNTIDMKLDHLHNGNDSDFLYCSVLSKWDRNKYQQILPVSIGEAGCMGRFEVLGAPLEWLYNYAYFGRGSWSLFDSGFYGRNYTHPVLEIKDSSKFKYSFKYGKNLFSYSLTMSVNSWTGESMMQTLQRELEVCLGFKSEVEVRNCPYWRLVADKGAKERLTTKMLSPYFRPIVFNGGFTAGDYPMRNFLHWIKCYQQDKVIIDETGISGNIDISIDCIPSDFEDLKRGLRSAGLDLVPSEMPMKVVVIRDKRETSLPRN